MEYLRVQWLRGFRIGRWERDVRPTYLEDCLEMVKRAPRRSADKLSNPVKLQLR